MTAAVKVRTEDVMYNFFNPSLKIRGTIYLDELDQAHVKIRGEEILLDCQ